MLYYLIFILIGIVFYEIAELTKKKGFKNLNITRSIPKDYVLQGESLIVTLIIENNKWLPISFLLIEERLPESVDNLNEDTSYNKSKISYNRSFLNVKGNERVKRTYKVKMNKRGVYFIKDIRVILGDIFAFSTVTHEITDLNEIVVFPKIVNLRDLRLDSTNLLGDEIVKRWIYKDPLFIRGIREYNTEDRMKDIHWKSSLKMNKLMVKDYDYTSDRELIFVIDVQCGDPYYYTMNVAAVERAITIGVSMANWSINEGISTGMWTDARIMGYKRKFNEVKPSIKSFKEILELCGRIDYTPAMDFSKFIKSKEKELRDNCTYVIISSYLNNEATGEIMKIKRNGYKVILVDVSENSDVPSLSGIEKMCYKGGIRGE